MRKSDGSPAVRIGGGGFGTALTSDGKRALILLPGDKQGRVQIVPVGPGQARVLRWDGIEPRWAAWFPDGQRILLDAVQSGQGSGLYITDVNGSTPKLVSSGSTPFAAVAPDGHSFFALLNGAWVVRPVPEGPAKPIPGIQAPEYPIAWTTDTKHVFTQLPSATGLTIYKIDVDSGRRELWQVVKPKEQVGLSPITNPTGITSDGRWITFTYGTLLGQLYRSDNLK